MKYYVRTGEGIYPKEGVVYTFIQEPALLAYFLNYSDQPVTKISAGCGYVDQHELVVI